MKSSSKGVENLFDSDNSDDNNQKEDLPMVEMTTASEFETGYENDNEVGTEGQEAPESEGDMDVEVRHHKVSSRALMF